MSPDKGGPRDDGEYRSGRLGSERGIADELSITFEGTTGTYRVSVDPDSDTPLAVAIVQALAAITQSDPLQLEPLVEYIDPEALERMYTADRSTSATRPAVSFSYADHQITVEPTTEITIPP